MRKNILLINKSGLNAAFLAALSEEGYTVVSFFESGFPANQRKLRSKYVNIFRRIVLKDKSYLQRLEEAHFQKNLIKRSQSILKNYQFDFVLFFRADLFPEAMISSIREVADQMVSYQYDGMQVCKNILNYTSYFDRIFIFDPTDYEQYKSFGFLPLTNCWFFDPEKISPVQRDFFYVGVGVDDRRDKIIKFQEYLDGRYSLKALLTLPLFRKEEALGGVEYKHKGISHPENMQFTKSSHAIIDFKLAHHNGLSFRFFEAMFYEKKIITNNTSVKNYDFYNSANIFITDFEDYSGLEEFMKIPFEKVNLSLVQKYSFSNWIKYVLDDKQFIKIELPICK